MRGANSFQKLMEGPPRRGMPAYASDHGAICGIGADTFMSKGAAVPNPFPCGVRGHRCAGCLGLACLRAEDPCFFGQGPWPDGAAPRDHPTWAPASASSTGGASAGDKEGWRRRAHAPHPAILLWRWLVAKSIIACYKTCLSVYVGF